MNKNQKGFAVIETVLIFVVVAILAATGFYVWHSRQSTDQSLTDANKTSSTVAASPPVKDFDGCQKAAGSITQQSYPEVCVTKGGQSFTQPVSVPASNAPVTYSSDCTNQASQYLVVNSWSVSLKLTSQISDAGCEVGSTNPDSIDLTAQVFNATTCAQNHGSLGTVARYITREIDANPASAPTGAAGPIKIGLYNYYFIMPQSNCSAYVPIQSSATADANAFKDAFQTLSPSP